MTHSVEEPVEVRITTADGTDVTEVVRQTYDMATSSMDYGSGFLSTDEMQALLDLARILRADDVLDVQAKLAQMKFPQGLDGPKHECQPDREGDIDRAHCLICGEDAKGWPYLHGLDVYPPEDRETVAEQIKAARDFQADYEFRQTQARARAEASAPTVAAQWERETGSDGTVTIRVTAAGVLPDIVLPHGKAKAVEAGDVIQFQAWAEHDPNCSSCPGGC